MIQNSNSRISGGWSWSILGSRMERCQDQTSGIFTFERLTDGVFITSQTAMAKTDKR